LTAEIARLNAMMSASVAGALPGTPGLSRGR